MHVFMHDTVFVHVLTLNLSEHIIIFVEQRFTQAHHNAMKHT